MKKRTAHWSLFAVLGLGTALHAQEPRPAGAAVEGIKGVKQDAVEKVKNVEPSTAAPSGGTATGGANAAQGVNKIDGIETVNGVKADGRTVIPPNSPPPPPPTAAGAPPPPAIQAVPPPPQAAPPPPQAVPPPPTPVAPPPPVAPVTGTAASVGGGSVGSAGNIRSVTGVAGLNTAKLRNLEAALVLKQGGGGTPTGTGAEKGGKGKSAAAALLAAPLEKPNPKAPKEDGRGGFQEFEKLQNNGS